MIGKQSQPKYQKEIGWVRIQMRRNFYHFTMTHQNKVISIDYHYFLLINIIKINIIFYSFLACRKLRNKSYFVPWSKTWEFISSKSIFFQSQKSFSESTPWKWNLWTWRKSFNEGSWNSSKSKWFLNSLFNLWSPQILIPISLSIGYRNFSDFLQALTWINPFL